jgi:hypothetical protein
MKVLKRILASINAQIYLHAGSHLGAIIHGQVIPWDDDLDAIMDFRKMDELYQICKGDGVEVHPSGVMLRCYKYSNAIKVWLHPEGFEKMTNKGAKWYSPFVDLFAYKYEDDVIWEVDPRGNKAKQNYNVFEYFPTRPFYFGGKRQSEIISLTAFSTIKQFLKSPTSNFVIKLKMSVPRNLSSRTSGSYFGISL